MSREQERAALKQDGEQENECHAHCGNDCDCHAVPPEQSAQSARPSTRAVSLQPQLGERCRHVDPELVRRRVLACVVTPATVVTEVGEVCQISIGKRSPQLHRGKDRAKTLAVATGVADRHHASGFFKRRRWHVAPPPCRRCVRTQYRWSCPTRRRTLSLVCCRP